MAWCSFGWGRPALMSQAPQHFKASGTRKVFTMVAFARPVLTKADLEQAQLIHLETMQAINHSADTGKGGNGEGRTRRKKRGALGSGFSRTTIILLLLFIDGLLAQSTVQGHLRALYTHNKEFLS